eukprot:5428945-Ditylum_brightwellii.AAC.1
MPTVEMVKTRHDKAATTTCSVDTFKTLDNQPPQGQRRRQNVRGGFHQRRQRALWHCGHYGNKHAVTATGMMVMVTATATATGMTVTSMTGHISRLVL